MKVGVVGAAGYAGGELLRLLLGHPKVDEIVAGSESLAGKPIISAHPNLRKRTSLSFVLLKTFLLETMTPKGGPADRRVGGHRETGRAEKLLAG